MVGQGGQKKTKKVSRQTQVDPSAEDPSFLSKRWRWLAETRGWEE